jgi:putative glutamine amidotransferase
MSVRPGDQPADTLKHNYIAYLQSFGITPVMIPNAIQDLVAYIDALDIQGVVLSGGNDVDPAYYGQENNGSESDARVRDQIEMGLLELAVERNMPVLGICRGLQVINVFFGGTLIQDIPTQIEGAYEHDNHQPHPVTITDPGFVRLMEVDHLTVNSSHHQGVTEMILAPDLDIFAMADDQQIIEGLVHPRHRILGTQWHLERPSDPEAACRKLIYGFLKGVFWK